MEFILLMQFLAYALEGGIRLQAGGFGGLGLLKQISLPSAPLGSAVEAGLLVNVLKAIHGLILQGM